MSAPTLDSAPPAPDDDPAPHRPAPHNTAAERALLGSWLISAEARRHHVDPADFYHPTSARIATAIRAMAGNGDPIDQLTVADHLERHDQLDAIGGAATLTALIAEVPLTGNAGRYAAIIRRDANHRRLLAACRDLSDAIYALDDPEIENATWQLLHIIAEQDRP